jgi:hypothetical protein
MEIPKTYLEQIKRRAEKTGAKSERGELVARFVERINAERKGTKFPQVTAARVNFMLAHLSIKDLYWLLGECEKADSFSKRFFGALKNKA